MTVCQPRPVIASASLCTVQALSQSPTTAGASAGDGVGAAGLAGEELPGTPTYADIHVVVRWPGGEVTSHSIRALERAAFTAATGIAPSYASDGPAPGPMPSEVAGPFRTDIGAVLARPEAPVTLAVVARLGPWRSEEVRLVLRP
jgi:hypothetical protein